MGEEQNDTKPRWNLMMMVGGGLTVVLGLVVVVDVAAVGFQPSTAAFIAATVLAFGMFAIGHSEMGGEANGA